MEDAVRDRTKAVLSDLPEICECSAEFGNLIIDGGERMNDNSF